MENCSNCGLCYIAPNETLVETYRCMRGHIPPMTSLFILARTVCDKFVAVESGILKTTK